MAEEKIFAVLEPADSYFYNIHGPSSPAGQDGENRIEFTLHVVEEVEENHDPLAYNSKSSVADRLAKQQELLQRFAGQDEQQQQQELPQEEQNGTSLQRGCLFADERLTLDCGWDGCSQSFSEMVPFMNHVSSHIVHAEIRLNPPPQEDSFLCLWEECGFESVSSQEMVRHINFHSFHTKIKCHGLNMLKTNHIQPCQLDSSQKNILPDLSDPLKCEWEGCDLANVEWSHAQKFYWHVCGHAKEGDPSDRVCLWANCMKKAAKFKDHVRSHAQERRVGCPTCGGLFSTRVKFMDHCKRQEAECGREKENTAAFSCSNCGKMFALERLLRDHVRSHINHHRCPHCDMTCPTPSTLASHIRYRHNQEKPFPCTRCEYGAKSLHDLKVHARIHGDAEEALLACQAENCAYTCRSHAGMKNHVLKVHVQRGPSYACHLCDKLYNRGSYLTRHLIRDHQYTWPSGHSRFRYNREETTGLYRLQTIRFESVELQEQLQEEAEDNPRSVSPCGKDGGGSGIMYRTSSPCPPLPPSAGLTHFTPTPSSSSSAGVTPATLLSPPPSSVVDGDLAALPVGSRSFRDEISLKFGGGSLRDDTDDHQHHQHWPLGITNQPSAGRRSTRQRENWEFDGIASGAPDDERHNHKKFKYWK